MIGIAKTGSGKTIAFGVPSVVHILGMHQMKACYGHAPPRSAKLMSVMKIGDILYYTTNFRSGAGVIQAV